MLYYNRNGFSEGIEVNKTNESKQPRPQRIFSRKAKIEGIFFQNKLRNTLTATLKTKL